MSLTRDSLGLRPWFMFSLIALACAVIIGGAVTAQLLISRSSCETKAAARPDVPMEWHWTTGCILLTPNITVVISG